MQNALAIWCVSDGKAGHKSQLNGLLDALRQRQQCEVHWFDCNAKPLRQAAALDRSPQLILCAGHSTHRCSLYLRWRYGGKLVVLMKPSLPRWLFDLCVVPRHDGLAGGKNVLLTRGPINDIQPSSRQREDRGLILIGGPSRHHGWDDGQILDQLQRLLDTRPGRHWTLTTSRRTPGSFLPALERLGLSGLEVVPAEQGDRDWLREQYATSGVIWATEDSASMVYEALTSGARVGVLAVPRQHTSRVSRGLDQLLEEGIATSLSGAMDSDPAPQTDQAAPLCEADRVAQYLVQMIGLQQGNATHEGSTGITPPR
ncbi:hypothetical protein FV139_10115 [Parahaliea maris]|uniref:Nucleoside-diphosphate sugar epimerase n=1 Tax=Parahaliea maris TaxID=2716870 RepID=A0A5C8ZZQ5_9GAMM|nr:mitochondrial fission ELM1 family protein [Parahaliea maris]TXS93968.1 hypothetical protein FV139_10115 [Parahaliea maris]